MKFYITAALLSSLSSVLEDVRANVFNTCGDGDDPLDLSDNVFHVPQDITVGYDLVSELFELSSGEIFDAVGVGFALREGNTTHRSGWILYQTLRAIVGVDGVVAVSFDGRYPSLVAPELCSVLEDGGVAEAASRVDNVEVGKGLRLYQRIRAGRGTVATAEDAMRASWEAVAGVEEEQDTAHRITTNTTERKLAQLRAVTDLAEGITVEGLTNTGRGSMILDNLMVYMATVPKCCRYKDAGCDKSCEGAGTSVGLEDIVDNTTPSVADVIAAASSIEVGTDSDADDGGDAGPADTPDVDCDGA